MDKLKQVLAESKKFSERNRDIVYVMLGRVSTPGGETITIGYDEDNSVVTLSQAGRVVYVTDHQLQAIVKMVENF